MIEIILITMGVTVGLAIDEFQKDGEEAARKAMEEHKKAITIKVPEPPAPRQDVKVLNFYLNNNQPHHLRKGYRYISNDGVLEDVEEQRVKESEWMEEMEGLINKMEEVQLMQKLESKRLENKKGEKEDGKN